MDFYIFKKSNLAKFIGFCFLFCGLVINTQAATTTSAVSLIVNTPTTVTTTPTTTPPGGGVPVPGCTDPLATNYSIRATYNDGSCLYGEFVPNALSFIATYIPQNKNVLLEWTLPYFPNFEAVRIVKAVGRVPISPTDGTLVYDGRALLTFDNNVSPGQTIYYALFVRSISGKYSGGLIDYVVIPPNGDNPPVNPPPTFPPAPPDSDGGSGEFFATQENIFTAPVINGAVIDKGRTGKPLTIFINYDRLPRSLKTVVATLINQNDRRIRVTVLLQANESKTLYLATVGPLPAGKYDLLIDVLNYDDQSLRHIASSLIISGATPLLGTIQDQSKTVFPFLVGAGLISGLANLLLLAFGFNSWFDFYLIAARALGTLLGFFGWRKKRQPWGTVYDAATKRPIDPAYVVAYDANTKAEVASAITDIDGRFGFLLKAGTYVISAAKTHYLFPSKLLAGQTKDALYDNLYFGANFTIKDNELLSINIPLDPLDFDWNEFVKTKTAYYQIYSRNELLKKRAIKLVYNLGFLATILFTLISPSWLNFGALGLYVVIMAVEKWWKIKYRPSVILKNSQPLSFGVLRLYFAEINQEVKRVVADEMGRFYLLVRPGTYYYTIEEKLDDQTYNKIYQSGPLNLDKGILPEKINL